MLANRLHMAVDGRPVAAHVGPGGANPFSIVRRMSGSSAAGGAPAAAKSSAAAEWSVTRKLAATVAPAW